MLAPMSSTPATTASSSARRSAPGRAREASTMITRIGTETMRAATSGHIPLASLVCSRRTNSEPKPSPARIAAMQHLARRRPALLRIALAGAAHQGDAGDRQGDADQRHRVRPLPLQEAGDHRHHGADHRGGRGDHGHRPVPERPVEHHQGDDPGRAGDPTPGQVGEPGNRRADHQHGQRDQHEAHRLADEGDDRRRVGAARAAAAVVADPVDERAGEREEDRHRSAISPGSG